MISRFRLILAAILFFAPAAQQIRAEPAPSESVRIPNFWNPRARGERIEAPQTGRAVRFLTDDEFPPLHFAGPDGAPTGFAVELARAVCERLAIPCTVQARRFDTLLVTIQLDMQDRTALALQEDLAARIADTGATGVMIDISGLEIVDSFVGRMLSSISGIARILSAHTVVVGMQPAVAITLVELGLSLEGVRTALNVERGMDLLRRIREEAPLGR